MTRGRHIEKDIHPHENFRTERLVAKECISGVATTPTCSMMQVELVSTQSQHIKCVCLILGILKKQKSSYEANTMY